jgi:hydrogenase/urease accessory protein HupE
MLLLTVYYLVDERGHLLDEEGIVKIIVLNSLVHVNNLSIPIKQKVVIKEVGVLGVLLVVNY